MTRKTFWLLYFSTFKGVLEKKNQKNKIWTFDSIYNQNVIESQSDVDKM